MTNNTMNNPSNIEHIVMRRVRAIRVLRPILSAGTLSIAIFIVALWGIGREVWVARVFQNMPHSGDLLAIGNFYLAAFNHTRFVVQALTFIAFASVVYFAREFVRTVSFIFTRAHA